MLREALALWRRSREEKTTSLQLRLFVFFLLFIVAILLAGVMIMIASGVFRAGVRESRLWMESELTHLSGSASDNFGKLSLQGTSFAAQLSSDMDAWMKKNDLAPAELSTRPELLEELLASQTQALLALLKNSQCSGTFIILDATVNPESAGAQASRAGIFLKRTEPNAVNTISSKIHYLRGPASIARANGIELLGQWQMEFDVSEAEYYHTTLDTARSNGGLALSRLFFWSGRITLNGNSESGMLLCLPIAGPDGTVYGVCGLEVSSMLFKLSYSPNNELYPRIFCTLAPLSDGVLDTDSGLIAGNSYLTNPSEGSMTVADDAASGLLLYGADESEYIGMHRAVRLYPTGSPYEDTEWALAVMMPRSDWSAAVKGANRLALAGLFALAMLATVAAVFISKRYISPVERAFEMIRSEQRVGMARTNISEIDDLLEYLSQQDAQRERLEAKLRESSSSVQGEAGPDLSAYQQFVSNIRTLSAAEHAVFELYMQGCTAQEISARLYLSMNTIKTHNKRIYTKLNVTSRKELMVYVQMMDSEHRHNTAATTSDRAAGAKQ